MRIWDLHRCKATKTLTAHTGAVWALACQHVGLFVGAFAFPAVLADPTFTHRFMAMWAKTTQKLS